MSMVSSLKRFFQTRDELSLINIRRELWALWLIFPLTVILGDFRYFNLNIESLRLQSYELMLYPLGLGWLVLVFIPKRYIIPLLKIAAVCCAAILPFQLLLTAELPKLTFFMAFQFFNGICAACAFSLFCFKLNNIERLFGMAMILFYYGIYYIFYRQFPAVQAVYKQWAGIAVMVFYLIVVFLLDRKLSKPVFNDDEIAKTADIKSSNIKTVIALHIVYYSIMCMINYIESADNIIFSLPYGLGQFASIIMIALIMIVINRNSLYIWLMFLAFSLLGLTIVNYNSEAARFTGSLVYGLGDGLGYIIIYYLCSGAINHSKSVRMYRLFCLILFIEYFFISGVFSQIFDRYEGSSHTIAITVVVILSVFCLLIMPYLQKKLFTVNWTDGRHVSEMPEYLPALEQAEKANEEENLGLSPREKEIFALLLENIPLKTIAIELGISYHTVNTHYSSIYRKLGINSKGELLMKYGKKE